MTAMRSALTRDTRASPLSCEDFRGPAEHIRRKPQSSNPFFSESRLESVQNH